MRLSAGIDSLSALEGTARQAFFGDSWAAMWGMRNRIAHGYLLVDPRIVQSTLERMPEIVTRIRRAMEQLP